MVPEAADVIHCYGIPESLGTVIEKLKVDSEFYMKYNIGKKPDFAQLIERVEQPAVNFDENHIRQSITMGEMENYKEQSQKVAQYYNQWQSGYDEVYGDTIQAFRPAEKESLMKYITTSAGIADGQRILDAGCGIGGPAIWIAKKFNVQIAAVTISQTQADRAILSAAQEGIGSRIDVKCLDYHELSGHFERDSFDRVIFLESLGHSGDPAKAIAEAFAVIKPGGNIYIKDFYYKEPSDTYWRDRIDRTIGNINRFYQYNTLSLTQTISALRANGFEIDFIRKFDFKDDISIRMEFEQRFGIDIFGGEPEFAPAEWLEIKCIKPLL